MALAVSNSKQQHAYFSRSGLYCLGGTPFSRQGGTPRANQALSPRTKMVRAFTITNWRVGEPTLGPFVRYACPCRSPVGLSVCLCPGLVRLSVSGYPAHADTERTVSISVTVRFFPCPSPGTMHETDNGH